MLVEQYGSIITTLFVNVYLKLPLACNEMSSYVRLSLSFKPKSTSTWEYNYSKKGQSTGGSFLSSFRYYIYI